MIILLSAVADFAGTVVGGQKDCLSRADKFKFCRANFLERKQRHKSAFNPEDLTSNFQGAVLGKILESNIVTEENIDKVIEFLNSLVILEPNDPSISETEVYIPSLSDYKSGIRLPLRYTIEPYYGEKVGFNNK